MLSAFIGVLICSVAFVFTPATAQRTEAGPLANLTTLLPDPFPFGVASGDASHDSIVLWTHVSNFNETAQRRARVEVRNATFDIHVHMFTATV